MVPLGPIEGESFELRYALRIGDENTTPLGSRGAPTGVSNLPPWLSLLRMVTYIKEGIAMRKIRVSSILTVYHDDQPLRTDVINSLRS